MFYTVYKVTNKHNNKIYIGVHKTADVNDSYLGSGKLIKAAVKKYGTAAFIKEVISIHEDLEDALQKEKALVDTIFVRDTSNYNIAVGGGLGGESLNGLSFRGRKHTEITKAKIRTARIGNSTLTEHGRSRLINSNINNEDRKQKISVSLKLKTKTEEHKHNLSQSLKEHFVNNPSKNKGRKKPVVMCPHCKKEGATSNMLRWHFNNCKFYGEIV